MLTQQADLSDTAMPGYTQTFDNARRWLIVMGVLTIIGGFISIILPQLTALTIELLVGVLLLVSGLVQSVRVFHVRHTREFWLTFLGAALSLLAGLILLFFPLSGILTLALILGIYFILEGAFKGGLAVLAYPVRGWGYLLFTALLAILLGILILFRWPEAAPRIVGLLIGIDLLFSGLWMLMLSSHLRMETVDSLKAAQDALTGESEANS